MRGFAFCLPFVLAYVAAAAEPNPFAPEGVPAEPARAPSGPPKSQREIDDAIAYLEDFPASPEAARVAFDVYVAATVKGEPSVASDMWTRLALDHPRSVQHRFLLSVRTPEDYRNLLVEVANVRRFDREFADDFLKAVIVGLGSGRGGEFLSGNEFLIQVCLAVKELESTGSVVPASLTAEQIAGKTPVQVPDPFAEAATETQKEDDETSKPETTDASLDSDLAARKELFAACRTRLEAGDQEQGGRKVAAILFEEGLSNVGRVLRLHAIEESKIARRCEEHFYDRLSDADRTLPEVMESRVELLLDREKFAEACPAVERLLADEETAKRVFWLGWCQAALGNPAAAETLAGIESRFPNDPWVAVANEAAAAVRESEARLTAQAEAAAGVVRIFAMSNVGAVEFRAEVVSESGQSLTAYGHLGFGESKVPALDIVVQRAEQMVLAAKSASDGSRVFMTEDASIHEFPGSLPVPAASFDVKYDAKTNEYSLNFNASIASGASTAEAVATLSASVARIVSRLDLASAAGVRTHLDRHIEMGYLPGPVEPDEAGRLYSWLTFSPRRPLVERYTFHVTPDGRLDRVVSPRIAIRDLRYGQAGSFNPDLPAWPDVPVVRHKKFDISMMFQMMTAATRLLEEEQPAESVTAAADGPTPR